MKNISILGSTGSIGTQALEIVRNYPDKFRVLTIAANKNIELAEKQAREFKPEMVCMYDEECANTLRIKLNDTDIKVVAGMDGLIECSTYNGLDMVITALVGMIGIRPTISAIKAGIDIALANKETLVTAGHIIMPMLKEYGVNLYPVDSEHSAIFQSLQGINYYGKAISDGNDQIKNIILTASGGPFRGKKKQDLVNITKHDALKHPNWSMGAKITIDSSTLVNKGLEMMEAGWLFGVPCEKINIVIHPQSILHSAVEFVDGAVIGQMGVPDMKLPILYALSYPERFSMDCNRLDLFKMSSMTFEKPDYDTFAALSLAKTAMKRGGSLPTVFNAANEYLVSKFLKDEIKFLDIQKYIEYVMNKHSIINNPSVEEILYTEYETYKILGDLKYSEV